MKRPNLNKSKSSDLVLAGDLFSSFIQYSLNTLTTEFLLHDKFIFQVIALASTIVSLITSFTLSNYIERNKDKFYNKRTIFFIIEGIINTVLVPLILIYGNKSLYIVATTVILTKPLTATQTILNQVMMNKTFDQETRLHHDILLNKYSSLVKVLAILTGFVANAILTPPIAYAIFTASEVVNNIFYMKQKPLGGDK